MVYLHAQKRAAQKQAILIIFAFAELKFPSEYPNKPPSVRMMTPSGRFEPGQPICMSLTNFHPGECARHASIWSMHVCPLRHPPHSPGAVVLAAQRRQKEYVEGPS